MKKLTEYIKRKKEKHRNKIKEAMKRKHIPIFKEVVNIIYM